MAQKAGRVGVAPSEVTPEGKLRQGGSSYVLPKASPTTLGGVKVGTGLEVLDDGTLNVTGGSGGASEWTVLGHISSTNSGNTLNIPEDVTDIMIIDSTLGADNGPHNSLLIPYPIPNGMKTSSGYYNFSMLSGLRGSNLTSVLAGNIYDDVITINSYRRSDSGSDTSMVKVDILAR